jgi:hypothetical protein
LAKFHISNPGHFLSSFVLTNEDKKWPGLEIWNFANFFTEDVKKKSYFSTIFWLYRYLFGSSWRSISEVDFFLNLGCTV